jgi:hypothetical protein
VAQDRKHERGEEGAEEGVLAVMVSIWPDRFDSWVKAHLTLTISSPIIGPDSQGPTDDDDEIDDDDWLRPCHLTVGLMIWHRVLQAHVLTFTHHTKPTVMAVERLTLFANGFPKPFFNDRTIHIVVVGPAFIARIVWRVNVYALSPHEFGQS